MSRMSDLKSLCDNTEEERFLAMRADVRFAKARKNRPAPLGMTILMELAKAVLDENVVATQTLKVRSPKERTDKRHP
jgi:hypothetical protein